MTTTMARLKSIFSKPLSENQIRRFAGKNGDLYDFLKWSAKYDVEAMYHNFSDVSVANLGWAVANSGGSGVVNFAIPSTKVNTGAATAASGTSSDGSLSAIHFLQWNGTQNARLLIKIKCDVVTSYNLEVGWIDAVPGSNNGAVSDVDTPATNMTDGAVLQIDTSQTITGLAFVTAVSGGTTLATTVTSPTVFTAGTYKTIEIALSGNNAACYIDGARVARHSTAITAGTLLAPWIYLRTRNTAAKTISVQYVLAGQDRA